MCLVNHIFDRDSLGGACKKKNRKATPPTVQESAPVSSGLTIRNIEVSGNRKIEKDAILTKLVSKIGSEYATQNIREDVEALFKLGFFNDIEVDRQVNGKDVTLTYKVLEKPSIIEIVYEGNSEVKSEDIADATGIKAYQLLNMAKVKEAVEKIQKLYEDKGFFLAKVDSEVQVLKQDETVKLIFKVRENDKVKVKKITFLGNKHLNDGQLKSKYAHKRGRVLLCTQWFGAIQARDV